MKRSLRLLALTAVALGLVITAGCEKLRARDQLNKGVQAYKNAKYEEAIEHFKNAVALDPALLNARLYLATAYAQQYIPGADTEDNNRMGQQAIEEYKKVLDANASREQQINSIKGIAFLYLQMKKFPEAKQTYQPRQEERAKLGLKPDEPLKDKKVCAALREKNLSTVEDGIAMLNKALQLRPDYDDAMAYLNLMYRERADIQCDDPAARAADLKTADEWVDKTMATKKEKAEKAAQQPGGIQMEPGK
jgi:tetratricopeptide (TPR) repeat protein